MELELELDMATEVGRGRESVTKWAGWKVGLRRRPGTEEDEISWRQSREAAGEVEKSEMEVVRREARLVGRSSFRADGGRNVAAGVKRGGAKTQYPDRQQLKQWTRAGCDQLNGWMGRLHCDYCEP